MLSKRPVKCLTHSGHYININSLSQKFSWEKRRLGKRKSPCGILSEDDYKQKKPSVCLCVSQRANLWLLGGEVIRRYSYQFCSWIWHPIYFGENMGQLQWTVHPKWPPLIHQWELWIWITSSSCLLTMFQLSYDDDYTVQYLLKSFKKKVWWLLLTDRALEYGKNLISTLNDKYSLNNHYMTARCNKLLKIHDIIFYYLSSSWRYKINTQETTQRNMWFIILFIHLTNIYRVLLFGARLCFRYKWKSSKQIMFLLIKILFLCVSW